MLLLADVDVDGQQANADWIELASRLRDESLVRKAGCLVMGNDLLVLCNRFNDGDVNGVWLLMALPVPLP